jgi:hypothetical protein
MSNMDMRFCKVCKRKTLHVGPSTSHVLHLILTVFTTGVWFPAWIFVSIRNEFSYECTQCDGTIVDDKVESDWNPTVNIGYVIGKKIRSALNRVKK